jgi:hypothetical protein
MTFSPAESEEIRVSAHPPSTKKEASKSAIHPERSKLETKLIGRILVAFAKTKN